MKEGIIEQLIKAIAESKPGYHVEAYRLVCEAMDLLIQRWANKGKTDFRAHELLEAFKELALTKFGPMTLMVLEEWGIRSSKDVGKIVFNLVEAGILGKSPSDKIEDFDEGFDFYETFYKPFLPDGDMA